MTCFTIRLCVTAGEAASTQVEFGLSNEAVGTAHAISAGTVKWHLGNVFGKLGVGNRTRAVTVARELGCL